MKEDHILTVDEAAEVLKVGSHSVYRWIANGDLPTARLGPKTYRVLETDLREFLQARIH